MAQANNKFLHISEIVKNYVQVLAWVLAAFWTLWVFRQTQSPFLETRGSTQSLVRWVPRPTNPEQCQANFEVTVGNVGNIPFDVVSVRIRRWAYKKTSFPKPPTFVDVQQIQQGQADFDREFRSGTLIRHYPPNQAASDTYAWLLNRSPDSILIFRADFHTKRGGDLLSPTYYWDQACSGSEQTGPEKGMSAADYVNLGSSYFLEGRYANAIEELNTAVKLDSGLLAAYFNRAVAYNGLGGLKAKNGDIPGARVAWRHAQDDYLHVLRLNPKYSQAERNRKEVAQELLSLTH